MSGKNVLAAEGVASKTVTATDTVKGNQVQALETVYGKNVVATEKATTLNLLVQALAETYDLNVSHVATLFRTTIKDYISSAQFMPGFTGNGMKLYKALNGDWNLELDNLTVRKAMTVFELIISKIRAVNGGLVISPANGKVKSVLLTNGIYRLEIEDDMMFIADDLIRCQSFSVKSGGKYYWVRVTSVSGQYVFVNASEFTNSLPAVGDDLVQFGNKTNKLRQGLLYLTAAEDGKPCISVLDGVNSTDLTDKTKVILGCLDDIVDSDFPADSQPRGYGLYAMNVFLKGMFVLRSGKTIESELNTTNAAVKAAQSVADAAKTSAGTAQATANTAVTNAATANALLTDLASDNKLTSTEKQSAKKEWDIIASEKPLNNAAAVKFGISTATYDTAYNMLNTYIAPLLVSLTTTSNITGTDFRAKFKAYYDARTNLLNAISAKAKSLADDAQASVDNLQVGGRNLLPNSDFSKNSLTGWTASADGNYTLSIVNRELKIVGRQGRTPAELNNSWNNAWHAVPYSFNQAGDYTLSFEAYATAECTLHFRANYFSYPAYGGSVQIGVNKKKYSVIFKNDKYDSGRLLGFVFSAATTLSIDNIQLEIGNKATDWTPAPEDIEAKITTIETNFEIREGQISAKVTEVTTKATQAATSATNAKTCETNASGSVTTAGQKATAAANSATAASGSATAAKKSADDAAMVLKDVTAKESSIIQTAGQIATKVTEVNTKVTEANTAATNAKKSETAAGGSATAASGSAATATTKAGEASTSAANAKKSADTATEKLTTITAKESSINQTASQISTKVTEVTKKATEASTSATNAASSATSASGSASTATTKANAATSSATAAAGSATTAGTKAGEATTSAANAKNSADSAAAKLTTITQKESSINQTASNITLQVTEVTNKASQATASAANATNAAELAMAMSQGKMLYRDPTFKNGPNGCSLYNNANNGVVTLTRASGIAGNPNASGYCLKITTTAGTSSPGWGGFTWSTLTKANQTLVVRFIANIPTGRSLVFTTNATGTGFTYKWLTGNVGTGSWKEYSYKIVCGSTGTFSTTAFFYLTGGATPTASAPLIWYLAYATVYDVTDAEIDYIADAAGKYTTKTEHSSSITQLSNSIELKVAKTDFNALGNRVSTAETTITQHTSQIALKAAQNDVTALGTRMSAAELKITPDAIRSTVKSQTDSIAASAASNAVNGLQVGGTNLCTNTGFYNGAANWTWWSSTGNATKTVVTETKALSKKAVQYKWTAAGPNGPYFICSGDAPHKLISNQRYTVSCWIKSSVAGSINLGYEGASGSVSITVAANTWTYFCYTFTYTGGTSGAIHMYYNSSMTVGTVMSIHSLKLEQGNKATDWTPAPEDVEADAQSKADAAKNAAINDSASKYTTKTAYESGITQLSNQIATKVTSTTFNALGNRVSAAESTIIQHTNQIALKATQTDVTALGTRMSSAEAKITPEAIKLTVKSQTDSIVSSAVKRSEAWVDATGLDQSKYYPVTMPLSTSAGMYTILIERALSTSYGKPAWSTHAEGFSVLCRWTTNACGWGVRAVQRTILDYTSSFSNVMPVGGIGQLTNWSEEYIYVRGGSKYRIVVEGATGVSIMLRTSDYTHTEGAYAQTAKVLTAVTTPVPDIAAINTRISDVETSFEIREGQISSKVTQATTSATTATTKAGEAAASAGTASTKATEAGTKATQAAGSASTAGTQAASSATSASNAKKAADDAAAKLVIITQKETAINQTVSSINLKATEVTTKATEAATSAGTAGTKATAAANSANAAASALSNVTTKQSEINVKADQITLQVSTVTTKTAEAINAAELAAAMSKGRMLYRDPTFESGQNVAGSYALVGSMAVVAITGCPNRLAKGLRITATGWTSATDLRVGGILFSNQSRANAVFVVRIVAHIPVGRSIQNYHNAYGTGGATKWLTSQAGIGKWQEYACKVTCGASGAFSTVNHFALTGGVAPTAAAPVIWYIAYATVFDTTGVDDVPTVDEIKSGMTVTAGKFSIFGKDISLAGAVTFSSLASDAQGKLTTAQSTADAAKANAATAQGTANTAVTNASTANALLSDIASDAKLTASEKQQAKKEWDAIVSEKVKNDASAAKFAVSTAACTTAYNALNTYITPLLANLTTTSPIVGTTFRTSFKTYYDARADLLNAISAKAKDLADAAQAKANQATTDAGNALTNSRNNIAAKLGYANYTDMEAKAAAGQTVITGGKIRTSLIDAKAIVTGALLAEQIAAINITTGRLTVTEGANIGGFKVFGNGLTNDGLNNDSYIVCRNDTKRTFAGIGGNVLPASTGLRAVARFENEDTTDQWGGGANYACILSAKNAHTNYALYLMNGFIGGMAVKVRQVSSSTILDHSDCWVSCYNTGTITVYLPSNPQLGKVIYIMRINNAQIKVNGNGKSIHYGSRTVSEAPINQNGEIDIYVYDGQYWMNGWMNH